MEPKAIYATARSVFKTREEFERFDRTCREKGITDWTRTFSPADEDSDPLLWREDMAKRIKDCAVPGTRKVWLRYRGTDCDHFQSSHIFLHPASVRWYERRLEKEYEWTDGTFSLFPLHHSAADQFKPEHRDLILEAHEDGHPHIVYC